MKKRVQKSSKKLSKISFSKIPKATLWVGLFTLVGVAVLLFAKAASPFVSIEPETMSNISGIAVGPDSNASNNGYIQFKNPGSLGGNIGEDATCVFASAPAGTQAAFCDGFNQPTVNPANSRSGDLNGLFWGVSRAAGSRTWQNYDTFDHQVTWDADSSTQISNGGLLCGQSGIFAPPNDIKICNGQLQDGTTNGPGGDVTALTMYPKQPFDFAGRTGTVSFDVSLDSEGGHDVWPEFWITDKPVPVPFQHQTSWASVPKSGFGVDFSASCDNRGGCAPNCQSAGANQFPVNIGLAESYNNYVKTDLSSSIQYDSGHCLIEVPRPGTGQYMNHIEIKISQSQVDIYGTDAAPTGQMTAAWIKANIKHMATIPIPAPGLALTKGLIWIEDDRYNPEKAREDAHHVYHRTIWDNVGFDGPKTYRDLAYDVPNVPSPAGATSFNPSYVVNSGASVNLTVKDVDKGTADKGSACTAATPCAILTLNYQASNVRPPTIDFTLNGHTYSYQTPFNDGNDALTGLGTPFYSQTLRTLAIPITISDVIAGDNALKFTNTTSDTVLYSNIDLIMIAGAPVP